MSAFLTVLLALWPVCAFAALLTGIAFALTGEW